MAIKANTGSARGHALAEINMVPLIDIMLVLVIVLLVTAPLLTHAVKVDLPHASSAPNRTMPDTITLTLDAGGALHWQEHALAWRDLPQRLAGVDTRHGQPAVHVRADAATPYRALVRLLAAVAGAGLTNIGFVSLPDAQP